MSVGRAAVEVFVGQREVVARVGRDRGAIGWLAHGWAVAEVNPGSWRLLIESTLTGEDVGLPPAAAGDLARLGITLAPQGVDPRPGGSVPLSGPVDPASWAAFLSGWTRPRDMHTYCITHRDARVPMRGIDTIVTVGSFRVSNGIATSDVLPFWDEFRPVALGTAGVYAVPAIDRCLPSGHSQVRMTLSRKIVLREAVGPPSPASRAVIDGPTARVDAVINELGRPCDGYEFLIPRPYPLPGGLLRNYAQIQTARDLVDYASLAASHGVIDDAEIPEFLNCEWFVPGGVEVGVFPRAWVIGVINQLERISASFAVRNGHRAMLRESYQQRVVAFVSERLGSYLLLRELLSRFGSELPDAVLGHLTCVVNPGESYSPGSILTD